MCQSGASRSGYDEGQCTASPRCEERSYEIIFGRPVNLFLGAVTAVFNVVILVLAALEPPIIVPAVVVGAVNLAVSAVVAFIANQPPTLNPGDTFKTVTPP